jgi:hypothetical protein
MSESEILEDYPELEQSDFRAVYDYAARLGRRLDWLNLRRPELVRTSLMASKGSARPPRDDLAETYLSKKEPAIRLLMIGYPRPHRESP